MPIIKWLQWPAKNLDQEIFTLFQNLWHAFANVHLCVCLLYIHTHTVNTHTLNLNHYWKFNDTEGKIKSVFLLLSPVLLHWRITVRRCPSCNWQTVMLLAVLVNVLWLTSLWIPPFKTNFSRSDIMVPSEQWECKKNSHSPSWNWTCRKDSMLALLQWFICQSFFKSNFQRDSGYVDVSRLAVSGIDPAIFWLPPTLSDLLLFPFNFLIRPV